MSVKLVRANSDTPNIQNNDDCRLFRYACGGYDGIVKGFGNELNYEISGSNFIVKSGEFVIDGWQGKIDGSGVSIAVDNLGGIQYYVVYAEIDLSVSANQKAEIKATYNTAYYPTISRGDDLTTTPSGVARIELYRFEASSGVISNVQQRFRVLDYGWTKNSDNTTTINGITIEENEDGIITADDYIISKKKLIGKVTNSTGATALDMTFTNPVNQVIKNDRKYELVFEVSSDGYLVKFLTSGIARVSTARADIFFNGVAGRFRLPFLEISSSMIMTISCNTTSPSQNVLSFGTYKLNFAASQMYVSNFNITSVELYEIID